MTLVAGVRGLESKHVFYPVGGGAPYALNDLTVGLPRSIVRTIQGLYDLPDMDEARQPAVGRIGEQFYPSLQRGKTVTYEGQIQAPTLVALRDEARRMRDAFAARGVGTMWVQPDPALDGDSHLYFAQPLSLTMTEEQKYGSDAQPSQWQRDFAVALRLGDPRLYAYASEGGPFGAHVASAADGATLTITNGGGAPTEPIVSVTPTGDTVGMSNSTLSRQLAFVGLTGVSNLTVSFRDRHAYNADTGADLSGKFVFGSSNWWDALAVGLAPGGNAIAVSGGAWTIFWWDANW